MRRHFFHSNSLWVFPLNNVHTSLEGLQARWRTRTNGARQSITLADGDDPRVRSAAQAIAEHGITPILVTSNVDSSMFGVEFIDPRDPGEQIHSVISEFIEGEARRKQITPAHASAMQVDPISVAVAATRVGLSQGCVAGATRPTGDVVRAALRMIGLSPQYLSLSSCFIMVMPDGAILAYGDCAVIPEPTAEQLADIALATAQTYQHLTGREPIVAMLSFSTKGSATHSSVDVVREALRIASTQVPELVIDGELQFDAAMTREVGEVKAPGSRVAGRANVLIFPNLAAGNITYKATQKLAGAQALGPILQGLVAPVNDLSRGCDVVDILNMALITSAQALAPVGFVEISRVK